MIFFSSYSNCFGNTILIYMTQPSSGGPRYTMDTSVFPYTADTEGYKRLSGRPVNSILKKIIYF